MKQNTLFLNDLGICPDTGIDCTDALQQILDQVGDNTTLHFKTGVYHIFRALEIKEKKKLSIHGNCATVIAHFDPCGPISGNNDVFHFYDCDDLEVMDFYFDTDNPMGAAGHVVAIDKENQTIDIRMEEEFPVTGFEHICATNSFNAEGSPDYAMATYYNTPYEQTFVTPEGKTATRLCGQDYTVIGDHLIRLNMKGTFPTVGSPENNDKALTIGHAINIRYEMYGNTIFNFLSCNRVLLKNIMIYAAASFGATVRPRSSDFTFDNFCIRVPKGSKRLKAANADGIHLLGHTGTLTLRNCNMEHMGDDTLNIHGIAGGISAIDKEKHTFTLCHPKEDRELPDIWAVPGDTVYAYDAKTFLQKGSFVIRTIEDNCQVTYTEESGEFGCGDILTNAAYLSAVHVDNCVLRNTRARGLLLQSHNILIENCYIAGMSLPAILCSPDIRVWYEVGPTKNVEIRNCVIEKCAHIHTPANNGAIVFKSAHDTDGLGYPAGVHQELYIHDNLFSDIANSGIYITASKTVRIEDNTFRNCCCDMQAPDLPHSPYDIVLLNCADIQVKGNVSDRGDATLYYFGDCENVTKA